MNRIRKLAAVVKEGVSNPEKIKKGLKVLKNQGPVIFLSLIHISIILRERKIMVCIMLPAREIQTGRTLQRKFSKEQEKAQR